MKKNYFLLLIGMICFIFILAACSQNQAINTGTDTPTRIGSEAVLSAEVDKEYTIKEGVKNSDIVAEVEIIEWIGESSEPSEKTFFNAKLVNVFKNTINPSLKEIKIMQDGNSKSTIKGYPLFAKGDKLFLFLKSSSDVKNTFWILGAHTSAIQIREANGRKYAIKFAGRLDELKNIEVNRTDELVSKDLQEIDSELLNEISSKSTPESFKKGKYNALEERQVLNLELLSKKFLKNAN